MQRILTYVAQYCTPQTETKPSIVVVLWILTNDTFYGP
jgi:hypothetical protein